MRAHPVDGEALVARVWPGVSPGVLHAVRHHHERLDGLGYPDGLTELPVLTALVAACDMLDALLRARSYKAAMPLSEAARVLRAAALPPDVVNAVLEVTGLCQNTDDITLPAAHAN